MGSIHADERTAADFPQGKGSSNNAKRLAVTPPRRGHAPGWGDGPGGSGRAAGPGVRRRAPIPL